MNSLQSAASLCTLVSAGLLAGPAPVTGGGQLNSAAGPAPRRALPRDYAPASPPGGLSTRVAQDVAGRPVHLQAGGNPRGIRADPSPQLSDVCQRDPPAPRPGRRSAGR